MAEGEGDMKKEIDIVNDIYDNYEEFIELLGLPKVKNIEREKGISALIKTDKQISRNKGFPRADIFVTHEDNTYSLIEVKKQRNKHSAVEILKGISQLLYYEDCIEYQCPNIRKIIVIDYMDEAVLRIIEKYKLNIIYVLWDKKIIKYMCLKEYKDLNGI